MKRINENLGAVIFAFIVLAHTGCTTPPEMPAPAPPKTQKQKQPPPEETQAREQQNESAGGRGAETEPATAAQTNEPEATTPPPSTEAPPQTSDEPPPSTSSADVEITDIPVDENGNPIVQPRSPEPAAAETAPRAAAPSQAGGGGAPAAEQNADTSSGGGAPPAGQNADTSSGGATPVAGTTIGPKINLGSATAPERGAALEQDLKAKLAKFDELMRKARADAAAERAAGGGGSAAGNSGGYAGNSGSGGRELPPPTGSGAGGQADTSSGLGHTPDVTGTTSRGRYPQTAGPIPNDIPDTQDDDIVARQLREAASRETDPALQQKLWEEYRKYKQGIAR